MALVLLEDKVDPIREEFLLGPVDRLGGLVVIVPARRAGDPGSNPGPGENFFSLIVHFFFLPINGLWQSPDLSQVDDSPFSPYF